MKRLVIAIDCDDVLVRTTPWFVEKYNELYGTSVTLEQSHTDSDEIWGATHAEMLTRFAQMIETDEYKELGPTEDEVAVLKYLSHNHELHLVTARQESERLSTQAMLDRDLSNIFTSMEFVGWRGSKGDICKRIKADILVDDNARHLLNAIEQGLPEGGALLFGDYPWNADDSNNVNLTHCYSWSDVKAAIDKRADQE